MAIATKENEQKTYHFPKDGYPKVKAFLTTNDESSWVEIDGKRIDSAVGLTVTKGVELNSTHIPMVTLSFHASEIDLEVDYGENS